MTTSSNDDAMAVLPPSGFADGVADRWVNSRQRHRKRQRWVTGAAVAAVVLTLIVAMATRRLEHAHSGSMVAEDRTTVEVGDRAVVVAEAGTSLAWAQTDGRWRVRQDTGSAFYRVETGEPFEVETPQGTIEVTGTCFAVEVHSVKPTTKKLLATAGLVSALSAATVVSLYEGRVVVASTRGTEVELEPGQSASLVQGHDPVRVDESDGPARPTTVAASGDRETALRNQLKMRREDVEELETEIGRLENELDESLGPEVGSDAWVAECATTKGETLEGCSYFDPSKEVLDEMARCGTLKVDTPPLMYGGAQAITAMKDDLGLEGEQAEAFERVAEGYLDAYHEGLEQLARDADVDPDLIEQLPAHALQQLLQDQLDKDEWPSIQQRLAQERAGHVPVRDVADQSLLDRYVRSITDVGDDFERRLADELGPTRARELRSARNGWGLPGWDNTRFMFAGKCDE